MPPHGSGLVPDHTPAFSQPSNERDAPLLDDSESVTSNEDEPSIRSPETERYRPAFSMYSLIYEISSLLLATMALVGAIVLLRAYERQPDPRWSLGGWSDSITLNTIISIISTVFRASLLLPVTSCISQFGWIWYTHPHGRPLEDLCAYDSASRGSSIGSLALLTKLRSIHLASVGAWVVLGATALGPFFQQSVTYISTSVVDPNYTPKAEAVASYSWGAGLSGWNYLIHAHYLLPYDLKAAARTGLLAPNPLSIPGPPFTCPTGNCTWDPFGTLAISSKCHNLSSSVRLVRDGGYVHFSAPTDDALAKMVNGSSRNVQFIINSDLPRELPSSILEPYNEMTGTVGIVQWVKAGPPFDREKMMTVDSALEAFRCAIYFSLRSVRPSVTNGVYSEEVLEEVVRAENAQDATKFSGDNRTMADPYVENWKSAGLVYQLVGPVSNGNGTFVVPFPGFVAMASEFGIDPGLTNGTAFRDYRVGQIQGDSIPTMLYGTDSIALAIKNMAESVTTQMRMNGSLIVHNADPVISPEQSVRGHVLVQQQLVVVRWAWLTLPAVLLLLSALFLVAAFVETRRSGVGMWLTSPLTLFFHARISRRERRALAGFGLESLDSADSMQKASQSLTAKIPRHFMGNIEVAIRRKLGNREEVEMGSLRGAAAADYSGTVSNTGPKARVTHSPALP